MVLETLEHMVPTLAEFAANMGTKNNWNFWWGRIIDTAKKWTLPVPTPTSSSL